MTSLALIALLLLHGLTALALVVLNRRGKLLTTRVDTDWTNAMMRHEGHRARIRALESLASELHQRQGAMSDEVGSLVRRGREPTMVKCERCKDTGRELVGGRFPLYCLDCDAAERLHLLLSEEGIR